MDEYNAFGQKLSEAVNYPGFSKSFLYTYDNSGRTRSFRMPDGTTGRNIVTTYSYDADNHLLTARSEADGLLREINYSYDENGKLATVTDPNGHTTTYSYDDADQLVSVTDALGQTTSYSYTANGELETVTLPNGTIMKYVYNGLGQKVQQIEDLGGLSLVTDYTYYPDGNLHTVTDAEQHTTTYSYDALDRVTAVVDTLSQTTSYAYDSAGNLRSLTDAEQQASGFAYNGLGQLEQESRPMGENTSYTYTASGKLETKTDANNQRTEYVYEAGTNLLTDIYYFDSSDTQTGHVSFTYERGQLSGYDDGDISASYEYNAFGQKLSETVTYPDFSKTFSYGYDANGQKRYFSMPDGTTYSYTYNDNNELEDIRIPGVGNISYPSYTLGLPDSMSSPGDTRSYAYDALARLEDLDSSTLDYSYSYDDVGNILTKTTEHGSYVYDYDDVYRLTHVDNPTLDDEAYTYDGVGNRETASGVSGAITHNANNELEVYGDLTYDYDANGNMISQTSASESWAYTYNVQNRLVQVEEDDLPISEYGYDPFGRRLWKEVDGVRTYFLYSDEGLVAEYDESGEEIRSYGYRPDSTWSTDPLWLKENGEYYWYQNDHLGTPQKLVDSTGMVVWSAMYTAFGKAVIDVETVTNNLRFPGQYEDAETGLHDNFHRYYDPRIGRYLKKDPIGFAGGDVNLYAYGWSNPINRRDMMGLRDCSSETSNATAKREFFNWLYHAPEDPNYPAYLQNLPQLAKYLELDEHILIALVAKEAGWQNPPEVTEEESIRHNIELNNPFGVNEIDENGVAVGNMEFQSLAHALSFWLNQPKTDDLYPAAIYRRNPFPYSRRLQLAKMFAKGHLTADDIADALLCEGWWKGICSKQWNEVDPTYWRTKFKELYPSSAVGWKDACSDTCDLK